MLPRFSVNVPGVYGLASDYASSISVVHHRSDVVSSMLRRISDPTPVHLLVLRQLSASAETVSGVPHCDSSCNENADLCTGHRWPSRWIPLSLVRVDAGILHLCSVLLLSGFIGSLRSPWVESPWIRGKKFKALESPWKQSRSLKVLEKSLNLNVPYFHYCEKFCI